MLWVGIAAESCSFYDQLTENPVCGIYQVCPPLPFESGVFFVEIDSGVDADPSHVRLRSNIDKVSRPMKRFNKRENTDEVGVTK